ncbi:MAG TPA: purine-nucleoside phosphorylase [Gemmataceae bacterium]|jgi:purine-nucleoside phosphorylase|nr:purine-nucleoside phosphorylase [Gemmataceae bacterium]
MPDLFDKVQEVRKVIESRWPGKPTIGIILGTGLGGLADEIESQATIPYSELPGFPQSTVTGHAGEMVCGQYAGKTVVAMSGRFHAYEGYPLRQITFPVRVLQALGCNVLIVSNACGGLNPQFAKGDIMAIEDHINLMGDNPLIGPNDDRLGDRFPDMSEPYDKGLLAMARKAALDEKIICHQGVYAAVTGPNLETRAEYRYLRNIGADVVGMSTAPEVIVAVHSKMKVLGFSVITDMCLPDALQPVSHEEIIAVANEAEKKLSRLVRRVVEALP